MQDKIKQQLGEMIFNADYSDTDNIISFIDQNFIGKEEVRTMIKGLDTASKAHDIAEEYDIMTSESPDYLPEMEKYVGLKTYEMVNRIKSLIYKLLELIK